MVRLMLRHGADADSPNGWVLQTAVAQGHKNVVEILLECGADVNACTQNPRFPARAALQAACETGNTDIVRTLLEAKADPSSGSGTHSTPIVAAGKRGKGEIMRMLVDAGAELDVLGGEENTTPLINAAAYLTKESVEILLKAGANINLKDDTVNTALMVAAVRGDPEALQLLLDNGADWMHSNNDGLDAIQLAFSATAGQLESDISPTDMGLPFVSSPEGRLKCLAILIQRRVVLQSALKTALDSGIRQWHLL